MRYFVGTLAALLALANLSLALLTCRQDFGRECSKHERTHLYLEFGLAGAVQFSNISKMIQSARFTSTKFLYNSTGHAATVSHNGSLYALFTLGGSCSNCGTACPDNSPHASKECKTVGGQRYHMGFVGYSKVNSEFGIDGDVHAFPFDLHFGAIETRFYLPTHATHHHFGVHDFRVFVWDQTVCLLVLNQKLGDQTAIEHVMTVQRIFTAMPMTESVDLHMQTDSQHKEHHSHQWIPIDQTRNINTGQIDFLFAQSIEQHQIAQCSHVGLCFKAAMTSNTMIFGKLKAQFGNNLQFQLGTNAVRVNETCFGAILNAENGKDKKMLHFAYLFQAQHPWAIVGLGSKPLDILPKPACHPADPSLCVTRVTGLTFVDGKLVISYSESEFKPKFFIVTVEELFENLNHISDVDRRTNRNYGIYSALMEGPLKVEQASRIERIVENHLYHSSGHPVKSGHLQVYMCGALIT